MTAEPPERPGSPGAPPGTDPGTDTPPPGPLLSGGPAPTAGWTPPMVVRQEVAPGLVFADTPSRLVAYVIDTFLVAIVTSILAELFGWGTQYPFGPGPVDIEEMFAVSAEYTILTIVIGGLYFIASWSGGRRATLGQRIFSIQVGNAFDGRALTLDQAVRRWLGFGDFAQVLAIVPVASAAVTGLIFVWSIVLLITTATSPTKQGLHDRLADSAVVRPANAGTGLAYGCLVLLIVLIVIVVLGVVALLFLGAQASPILPPVTGSR